MTRVQRVHCEAEPSPLRLESNVSRLGHGHARGLDLTVRGIALCDETVHYVRRCNLKMLESAGIRDRHIDVLIERPRSSAEAHAYVALANGPSSLRARGRDLDALLAVREAFDRLTSYLLEIRAPARTPLALMDESLAQMRVTALRLGRR